MHVIPFPIVTVLRLVALRAAGVSPRLNLTYTTWTSVSVCSVSYRSFFLNKIPALAGTNEFLRISAINLPLVILQIKASFFS